MPGFDRRLELAGSLLQSTDLAHQRQQRGAGKRRDQVKILVFDKCGQNAPAGRAMSNRDPILREMSPQGVDEAGALADQQIPRAIQGQRGPSTPSGH